MKILLIHNYYRYKGGEETYFESLTQLLKNKGHKVFTYTKDSKNISESLIDKFKVAKNLVLDNKQVLLELSLIIKKFKPDIAHCNNIFPLITPTVYNVCKSFSLPIVQTVHNYRILCPKGTLFRNGDICELCVKKRFKYPSIFFKCYQGSSFASAALSTSFARYEKLFRFVDYFIFPSNFTQNYYLKHNSMIKNKKTSVIPYFVPQEDNLDVIKSNYFLYAGRLSEEKGVIELLDIFKTNSGIKIKIVGDGPLKKGVNEFKKYNNIEVIGSVNRNKIRTLMAKAQCIIIPSLWFEVLPYFYL